MRVGEAIIDLLVREYELDTVFGIPGVHNIELFRGLHSSGVRVVAPRHEQGAGFMADGWSIATGKPGVCLQEPTLLVSRDTPAQLVLSH